MEERASRVERLVRFYRDSERADLDEVWNVVARGVFV